MPTYTKKYLATDGNAYNDDIDAVTHQLTQRIIHTPDGQVISWKRLDGALNGMWLQIFHDSNGREVTGHKMHRCPPPNPIPATPPEKTGWLMIKAIGMALWMIIVDRIRGDRPFTAKDHVKLYRDNLIFDVAFGKDWRR